MNKKSKIRDIIMALLMLGTALYVFTHPAEKQSAEEKIDMASFVPYRFGDWRSKTYDTSDYKDKWQSINELLVRDYYNPETRQRLGFILEYSSDLRKNFSFHFPESCHRAGGNEVVFLEPLEIDLGNGRVIKAKCLYIKGVRGSMEHMDKVVGYWLTIDNKQYYQTFFIKLDQMLSGLLKRAKQGFLLRVDCFEGVNYDDESTDRAKALIREFVRDLYDELDDDKRSLLFGRNL